MASRKRRVGGEERVAVASQRAAQQRTARGGARDTGAKYATLFRRSIHPRSSAASSARLLRSLFVHIRQTKAFFAADVFDPFDAFERFQQRTVSGTNDGVGAWIGLADVQAMAFQRFCRLS